jgi:hypothetical protein
MCSRRVPSAASPSSWVTMTKVVPDRIGEWVLFALKELRRILGIRSQGVSNPTMS